MSTAIESSLDDAIAVTTDSTPSTSSSSTTTTTASTRVIKQPLIQVYFPITFTRSVDVRLPVARTATACGIYYSTIFLASSSLSSLDMPKISRATQARLLRKANASIPASTSTSTSLSAPQQSIPPAKDTSINNNDTPRSPPSPNTMTLARDSNDSNNNNEACCNSHLSESSDIVTKKDDEDDGSDGNRHLATATTATAPAAVDEPKDNIHASTTLEPAIPTPHLSTPPSRSSSSSSRIPIRKSNSMPTAKSPEAITTRRAPTTTAAATTTTTLHKRKHDGQQQTPRPRSASPKPSTAPVRNKTTSVNRSSSPSPKSIATKVREADVPMPKKPIPTSPPLRIHHGAHKKSGNKDHTKQGNEDEEDEAPVRITAQERRRRENMRAQQIKMWRVREEREARDARTIARRKMMERPTSRNKEPSPPPTPPRRAVKFNLKRNKVIEISHQ